MFNPSSGVSWRHSTFRDLKKFSVAIEKNPTPANVKACQIVVENILPELETVGLSRHFTETNEESLFRNSLSKNDNSPWEASIGLPSRYTVNLSCIGNKSLSATPRLWVRRHTTGLSYNFHWGLNPEPRYMLCYKQYHFGFCNNLTRPRFVIGRTFQANKIKTELSIHASISITQKKKIFIDNSDIFFQVKKIFEPKEFYVYDKKLGFTIPVSADFNTELKTINPRNRFFSDNTVNNIAYLALDSLDSLDTPVSANEDSSLVQTVSISPSPQNNIEPTRSGSHNIFFRLQL